MPVKPRNLDWVRGLKIEGHPDAGARLYELLTDLSNSVSDVARQSNASLSGNTPPPPSLQGLVATPTPTGIHLSIQHEGEYYRGVEYQGEYAYNPSFTNPFPFHMGPSREHDLPIGNQTVYVRAFGTYPTSGPTQAVYHGGQIPQAVTGGAPYTPGLSQGAGTGRPGQGLQGYGGVPFSSKTGVPPAR